MRYECCVCKKVFPAEERIDGYAEGYRVGFLCPRCGANVQDNPFSGDSNFVFRKNGAAFRVLAVLGTFGLLRLLGHFSWNLFGVDVSLAYIALGVGLAVIAYLAVKNPEDLWSPILSTQKVE